MTTSDQRRELANHLLKHSDYYNEPAISADPGLLLEAVSRKCLWGVDMLLKHGVKPLAYSEEQ